MALLALRYGVTSARRWRATQDILRSKKKKLSNWTKSILPVLSLRAPPDADGADFFFPVIVVKPPASDDTRNSPKPRFPPSVRSQSSSPPKNPEI